MGSSDSLFVPDSNNPLLLLLEYTPKLVLFIVSAVRDRSGRAPFLFVLSFDLIGQARLFSATIIRHGRQALSVTNPVSPSVLFSFDTTTTKVHERAGEKHRRRDFCC